MAIIGNIPYFQTYPYSKSVYLLQKLGHMSPLLASNNPLLNWRQWPRLSKSHMDMYSNPGSHFLFKNSTKLGYVRNVTVIPCPSPAIPFRPKGHRPDGTPHPKMPPFCGQRAPRERRRLTGHLPGSQDHFWMRPKNSTMEFKDHQHRCICIYIYGYNFYNSCKCLYTYLIIFTGIQTNAYWIRLS